jgi:hypothetical protein
MRVVSKLLAMPEVRWDEEDGEGNTPATCAKKGGFGPVAEKVRQHAKMKTSADSSS